MQEGRGGQPGRRCAVPAYNTPAGPGVGKAGMIPRRLPGPGAQGPLGVPAGRLAPKIQPNRPDALVQYGFIAIDFDSHKQRPSRQHTHLVTPARLGLEQSLVRAAHCLGQVLQRKDFARANGHGELLGLGDALRRAAQLFGHLQRVGQCGLGQASSPPQRMISSPRRSASVSTRATSCRTLSPTS